MTQSELRFLVKSLKEKWEIQRIALNAPPITSLEKGNKGENSVIVALKIKNTDWVFRKTPQSRTPADIIGVKQTNDKYFVWLIQVKTGTKKYINRSHLEIETLPILKNILTRNFLKDKELFVSTGFILQEKKKEAKRISNRKLAYINHFVRGGKIVSENIKEKQEKVLKFVVR